MNGEQVGQSLPDAAGSSEERPRAVLAPAPADTGPARQATDDPAHDPAGGWRTEGSSTGGGRPGPRQLGVAAVVASTIAALIVSAFALGLSLGQRQATSQIRVTVVDAAAAAILREAQQRVTPAELTAGAVAGMLRAAGDQWGEYYTPVDDVTDYAAVTRYDGVGVWLRVDEDGRVVIASVVPGSSAAEADLTAGMLLLAVNGRSTAELGLQGTVAALRGQPGQPVRMRVLSPQPGAQPVERAMPRNPLRIDPVSVRQDGRGILWIGVTSFRPATGREVRAALASYPNRLGVVLDLRGNGGGLLAEGVEVASAFTNRDRLAVFQRRGRDPQPLLLAGGGDTETPLVVLIDGGTASTAEVVAAGLRDLGRAVLVGQRTYGKSSVQDDVPLPGGSRIRLTVGYYLTPSGLLIDGEGIEPDIQLDAGDPDSLTDRVAVVLEGLYASTADPG